MCDGVCETSGVGWGGVGADWWLEVWGGQGGLGKGGGGMEEGGVKKREKKKRVTLFTVVKLINLMHVQTC